MTSARSSHWRRRLLGTFSRRRKSGWTDDIERRAMLRERIARIALMPKAAQTASRRRARSATAIRRFLVLDALRSWVVPTAVAAIAFVLWVLYNVDLVAPAPSVTIGGGLILFTAVYAGLRVFFD